MVTRDGAAIDALANEPEIAVTLLEPGADIAALVRDEQTVTFACTDGAVIYRWVAPGVYCMHPLFRPQARGKTAWRETADTLTQMFATVAETVFTDPRLGHVAAAAFARRLGFSCVYETDTHYLWECQKSDWRRILARTET